LWTRRLRWRMRGAWLWPAFAALTLLDGVILHLLPPRATGFPLLPGVFLASFGNLVLVGAVAPWIVRRLEAREAAEGAGPEAPATPRRAAAPTPPRPPREVRVGRVAVALMCAATLGLVAVGLASRPLVVSETEATEEAGRMVRDYVAAHGSPEVRRNLDTANTYRLEQGYFRVCIARDDRTKASCLYVDTRSDTVRPDPNPAPNQVLFGRDP
jgi:hypothetical protein